MRILFSSTPAHGHLLPQFPLAHAFRERGDDVAFLTAGGLAPVLAREGFDLLPAGPTVDVLVAEAARRTGADPKGEPAPEVVAEFFAGARIDLTADEALAAARDWRPELIVTELCDYVGPLAAADLDVPVATLAYGPAMPPEFRAAMDAVAAVRYAERGLTARPAAHYLDTCPPAMQQDGWQPPSGRLPLRPEPHGQGGRRPSAPADPEPRRPRVLVTFGTVFSAPEVLSPILRELSASDAELRVTLGLTASAEDFDVDHDRVTFVGFTPLSELLHDTDLVVTHGGAGTTLGTLAAGIPMVVVPQGADQFIQADRVAAAGAGLGLPGGTATPEGVAKAASAVLADQGFRAAARTVADQIAAMPAPAEVAATLAAEQAPVA
ncbi:glycosyltransferase [Streptomyces sp. 35G-GA-8]|uniref:glycosyltransferase n=1 Tax=Streptomyces sp. 35G-GA-8 TaxID=2939434 RepID=UPI00201F0B67|nr:glycosyltransferase [Streptomyces sp. 35G-GA-8]MCL7381511.1 glycosyltransferase [Streptomyces sp. 35G-GA-8]